ALLSALAPALILGGGTFLTTFCLLLVAVPLWRLAFEGLTKDQALEERVLIVGTGPLSRTIARHIIVQHDFAYELVGFVDDGAANQAATSPRTIGVIEDLGRLIQEHQIDRVVV